MPTDRDTERDTDRQADRQKETERGMEEDRVGERLRLRREGEERDRNTERMKGERGCGRAGWGWRKEALWQRDRRGEGQERKRGGGVCWREGRTERERQTDTDRRHASYSFKLSSSVAFRQLYVVLCRF